MSFSSVSIAGFEQVNASCEFLNRKVLLTIEAPISQNGQTHLNCRRIVSVCLTILWDWRIKG